MNLASRFACARLVSHKYNIPHPKDIAINHEFEVIPVDRRELYYNHRVFPGRAFTDVNLPEKRGEPELPPTHLYVCEKSWFQGRCQRSTSKRGFCCTCCFQIYPPALPLPPSQATRVYSLSWCAIDLAIIIIPDTLKNGWNNEISSFCPHSPSYD